jgi:uncharacterized glyoxalase superfamily protein PhnB
MPPQAQRPPKPANMPWVIPYLTVRDPAATLMFYEKAFGFCPEPCMKGPDGKIMHAEMRFRDGVIMFGPEGAPGQDDRTPASTGVPSPVSLYIYCEDVDAFAQRARSAGARLICEPTDMFWGDRICTIVDPDGHRWTFATNVAEFDPTKAAMEVGCA